MDLKERPTASSARRHPWEVARYDFFRRLLGDSRPRRAIRVLDVGSGDAWLASELLKSLPPGSRVTCWDAGYSDELVGELRAALPSAIELVRERPTGTYDVVLLLDVLEHVERDLEFLEAIVRENVAPDGLVLFSVPAWQALYTEHDRRLDHFRRYSPAQARAVLERAGLAIEQRGGLFHSLLPIRALAKARESVFGVGEAGDPSLGWDHGALVTGAIDAWLRVDSGVSRALGGAGIELPGLSWWAACRKR